MNTDIYKNFYCRKTNYIEYKIPTKDFNLIIEVLQNEITVDGARLVNDEYWYVMGRKNK